MMLSPRRGQLVQIWYKDRSMPYHGAIGMVRISGRGKPRNHLVLCDMPIVVPCGNVRAVNCSGGWLTSSLTVVAQCYMIVSERGDTDD